jgi:hypothetical protein
MGKSCGGRLGLRVGRSGTLCACIARRSLALSNINLLSHSVCPKCGLVRAPFLATCSCRFFGAGGRPSCCCALIRSPFRRTRTSACCACPRSRGCLAVSDENLLVYSIGPKCSLARAPFLATVLQHLILSQPRQRQTRVRRSRIRSAGLTGFLVLLLLIAPTGARVSKRRSLSREDLGSL